MRIHGYCQSCHRIRRVQVAGAQLAMLGRGVVTGTCQECDDAAAQERAQRRPPRL